MSVEKPKAASGKKYTPAVADPRGARDAPPTPPLTPRGPNSFNFMQFWGNFGKIVCWCPHLGESWIRHWPVDLCGNCYHH